MTNYLSHNTVSTTSSLSISGILIVWILFAIVCRTLGPACLPRLSVHGTSMLALFTAVSVVDIVHVILSWLLLVSSLVAVDLDNKFIADEVTPSITDAGTEESSRVPISPPRFILVSGISIVNPDIGEGGAISAPNTADVEGLESHNLSSVL